MCTNYFIDTVRIFYVSLRGRCRCRLLQSSCRKPLLGRRRGCAGSRQGPARPSPRISHVSSGYVSFNLDRERAGYRPPVLCPTPRRRAWAANSAAVEDEFSLLLQPLPEPSTWVMRLSGFVALSMARLPLGPASPRFANRLLRSLRVRRLSSKASAPKPRRPQSSPQARNISQSADASRAGRRAIL